MLELDAVPRPQHGWAGDVRQVEGYSIISNSSSLGSDNCTYSGGASNRGSACIAMHASARTRYPRRMGGDGSGIDGTAVQTKHTSTR